MKASLGCIMRRVLFCNIVYLVVLETEPRASYVLDNVCTPACVLSPPTLAFDANLAKLSREALHFAILLSQPSQKADIIDL